jgi:hypothetical protein
VDAALVDGSDARMGERGGELGLAEEALEVALRLDPADELEGDAATPIPPAPSSRTRMYFPKRRAGSAAACSTSAGSRGGGVAIRRSCRDSSR